MKKKNLILLFAGASVLGLASFTAFNLEKSSNGTKTAYTNSPHDGSGDCTGCHSGGSVTPVVSLTASPAFGAGNTYVPGTSYTISYKVTGYSYFGFDIELNNGNTTTSMGAGTNTALTHCQVTANPYSAGYPANVSHTARIPSSSAATWTWVAPTSGTVYIYSVGLGVNGDGGTSGDKMVQYNLVLTPASTTGINEVTKNNTVDFSFFPNPTKNNIQLKYSLNKTENVSIKVYNLEGQLVATLLDKVMDAGEQTLNSNLNLSKGMYTLSLSTASSQNTKKLVIE